MASEPSSSFSSSTDQLSWKFDVFISFSERDSRREFVADLYTALTNHGLVVYWGDIALHPRLPPEHLKAIEGSRFVVVFLSRDYPCSVWCLDQLVDILKNMRERGEILIPNLYILAEENPRPSLGWRSSMAQYRRFESWIERDSAISAAKDLGNSRVYNYGHESVEEIVENILLGLSSVKAHVARDLIGMEPRMKHVIEDLLKIGSGGVRMIGICGISGGGKTTLAKAVYNKIFCKFGGRCSFVENLKEDSRKYGLKKLQEKVLTDVFKARDVTILRSIDEGKRMIKKWMRRVSVLIVVDDVDHGSQLEALVGAHQWFGDGSRIIITTRNKCLLEAHGVDSVHQVESLKEGEALELFNSYAFPMKEYENLPLDMVRYAGDLPLTLKVLGSHLCGKEEVVWTSALDDLKLASTKTSEKLKISYNGLKPDEKEVFLYVALFLRNREKAEVLEILDACGYKTDIVVDVLNKSLISISKGCFQMHDLIQEMGLNIILKEHPEERSWIWQTEELLKICSGHINMKTEAKFKGIQVSFDEELPVDFSNAFKNMKDLRFLDISISQMAKDRSDNQGPNVLPNSIRWLSWSGYPGKHLPLGSEAKDLVIMRMTYSKIVHLSKEHQLLGLLPKLKMLDLSGSKDLVSIASFIEFPNLERLILQNCRKLKLIGSSIGNLERLVLLDMSCCSKLKTFPPIVRMTSLEVLILSGCTKLRNFPEIQGDMDSLKHLSLQNSGIRILPDTIGRIRSLVMIDLCDCKSLKKLSLDFNLLTILSSLKLSGCTRLEELPESLGDLPCLKELLLDYTGIRELPAFILDIMTLTTFSFKCCVTPQVQSSSRNQ